MNDFKKKKNFNAIILGSVLGLVSSLYGKLLLLLITIVIVILLLIKSPVLFPVTFYNKFFYGLIQESLPVDTFIASIVLFSLCILAGVLIGFKKKLLSIQSVDVSFFALLLTIVISALLNIENPYTQEKLISIIINVICAYLIFRYFFSEDEMNKYFKLFVLLSFISCIYFLGFYEVGSGSRNTVADLNPIYLSRALGISVIMSIYLYYLSNNRYFKILLFFNITLGVLVISLTGSQGPLFFLLISFLITFTIDLLTKKRIKSKMITTNFLLLLLFIIVLIFLPDPVQDRLFSFDISESNANMYRIIMFSEAFNLFINEPLYGIGTGLFSINTSLSFDFPHNMILEVLAENGLIGVLLLFTFLVFVYKNIFKGLRSNKFIYFVLAWLINYGVLNSMVSGSLGSTQDIFIFSAITISLLIRNKSKLEHNRQDENRIPKSC